MKLFALALLIVCVLCSPAPAQLSLSLTVATFYLDQADPDRFEWDGGWGYLNMVGRAFYTYDGGITTYWMLGEVFHEEYDEELEATVRIPHTLRVRVSLATIEGGDAVHDLYVSIDEVNGNSIYAGNVLYDPEYGSYFAGGLIVVPDDVYPYCRLQLTGSLFEGGGGSGSGGAGGGFPTEEGPEASSVEADDSSRSAVESAFESAKPALPESIGSEELPNMTIDFYRWEGSSNGGIGHMQQGSPDQIIIKPNPTNTAWAGSGIDTARVALRGFLVLLMVWGTFDYILRVVRQW